MKIMFVLNILPIIGLAFFSFNLINKNRIFSEKKILQCFQNDLVVNFNDVIRIVHFALDFQFTQSVAILTFE